MKVSKVIGHNPTMNMFFVVFLFLLILKMANVVTISWWIVTAPLWFPVGLLFVILVMFLLHAMMGGFLGENPDD